MRYNEYASYASPESAGINFVGKLYFKPGVHSLFIIIHCHTTFVTFRFFTWKIKLVTFRCFTHSAEKVYLKILYAIVSIHSPVTLTTFLANIEAVVFKILRLLSSLSQVRKPSKDFGTPGLYPPWRSHEPLRKFAIRRKKVNRVVPKIA